MDLSLALEGMLSSDNSIRLQAESSYYSFLLSSPDTCMISLVTSLPFCSLQSKTLASLLLKQLVDPLSSKETWSKISASSQTDFKSHLIQILSLDLEPKPSELLSDVAAKLACNIFSANLDWPELTSYIRSNLTTTHAIKSLEILSSIYIYKWKEIPLQPELFTQYFNSEDIHLKFSAIKVLNSLLGIMKKRNSLKYAELVPQLLSTTYMIITKDLFLGGKALEVLREVVENKGFIFTDYINVVFEFVGSSFKSNVPINLKLMAAEVVVSLYESTSELETSRVGQLMQEIFVVMASAEVLEDDMWCSPEEGYTEDQNQLDTDLADIGRKLINRLIESVGESTLLEPALSLVHSGLNSQDWRAQYSALLTLGELIPFIAEPSKISDTIPICITACNSSNFKVRYAGFNLISDLSRNYIQEFQAAYHNKIFPIILSGCHDSIPRVRAQALSSLTSFIEGSGHKISVLYISSVPYIVSLFHNQISIVIEYAVTSISAFAKSGKSGFLNYYQETIDELLKLMQRLNLRVYDNIRARVVECISLCSIAVGKQMFSTKIQEIIAAIAGFEVGSDQEALCYILSAWENICELLNDDFSEYLDHVVPNLLKFVASPNEGVNVNTAEVINKEHALQALCKFVKTLKGKYWKYLDETLRATLPLVTYTLNDSLRATAAEMLAGLVEVKKNTQESSALAHSQELGKVFLSLLVSTIKDEFNRDALISQLESVSNILIIIDSSFLAQNDINDLGSIIINLLSKHMKKGFNIEDDALYIELTEVIGSIFKTHPYFSSNILNLLFSELIPKMLIESKEKNFYKYILYMIDDALEYLSVSYNVNKWDEILSLLLCYASDTDDEIRQAAVYGLGLYVIASQNFQEKASIILTALFCSLEIPSKRIKTYGHARDNSIGAISKLLKYKAQYIDFQGVCEKWIALLPLKWDKIEAVATHEFFADLLEASNENFLVTNYENFNKAVKVIADISCSKFVNESTEEKLKKFLWKHQEKVQGCWGSLTDIQKDKINKLFSTE